MSGSLLLAGCAAFQGVKATDLSPISVGISRAEVEEIVGAPDRERPLACGRLASYTFNRGREPYQSNIDIAGVHPAAPLLAGIISHPFLVAGQQGRLDVVYGPDERVIDYLPGRQADVPRAARENGLSPQRPSPDEQAELYERAAQSAATAVAAWGCHCMAAQLGSSKGQLALALSFRDGTPPVAHDHESALVYAMLAARDGRAPAAASALAAALAATLPRAEAVAAETRAAAWSPDTAWCRRVLDAAAPRAAAG